MGPHCPHCRERIPFSQVGPLPGVHKCLPCRNCGEGFTARYTGKRLFWVTIGVTPAAIYLGDTLTFWQILLLMLVAVVTAYPLATAWPCDLDTEEKGEG